MRRTKRWRGVSSIAAVLAGLSAASAAQASHFRGGSMRYRIPDPVLAPLTAQIDITISHSTFSPITQLELQLGDGGSVVLTAPANVGVVPGSPIGMTRFTALHTYPSAGSFTAFFSDCCYASDLYNGGEASVLFTSSVVVGAGHRGGPVAPLLPTLPLQTGGLRTFLIPIAEHDGGPTTCAISADPGPPMIPGGAAATVTSTPEGCLLSWDTTGAIPGHRYRIALDLGDADSVSSRALSFVVEMRTDPGPSCTGGGLFTAELGLPFSTQVVADTLPTGASLALSTWEPFGLVSPAPGTSQSGPFSATYSFTPVPPDVGAHASTLVFADAQKRTGLCPMATYIAPCPAYGTPCSAGVGACETAGFQICQSGQAVCNAVAGAPQPETCDGLDNDCNGAVDDALPDLGAPCSTGLPSICDPGNMECTGGAFICVPTVLPGTLIDICDGIDNDCDGATDELFSIGTPCSAGVGACLTTGTFVCLGPASSKCGAVAGSPTPEVCANGLDEDCDGTPDDGCPAGSGGAGGEGGSGQGGSGQGGSGQGGSGATGGGGQGGSGQGGSGPGGSASGGAAQGGSGAAGEGGSGPGGSPGAGASGPGGAGGTGGGDADSPDRANCNCRSAGASPAGSAPSELAWWLLATCLFPLTRRRSRRPR